MISDKLIRCIQSPAHRGSFPEKESNLLHGECRDDLYNDSLMLIFKWSLVPCLTCRATGKLKVPGFGDGNAGLTVCGDCHGFGSRYFIDNVHYISLGCFWLLGVAEWFSEYCSGKRVEEVMRLTEADVDILGEVPFAGGHCSKIIIAATTDALNIGFRCFRNPI